MSSAVRIAFLTDPGPARKGLQDIATAAENAGAKAETALKGVGRAADTIDTSKAKKSIDDIAESTDEAATKTGTFASALGAFAGGLEAVGLDKYAGALTAASVGVDVFSNASDVATLALESKYVKLVRDKIATAASATASLAASAATKTAAAGQWLLNAAMSANPIGLVVIAIAALVAGLIIAYKKSETFRTIVNAAFGAVKTGVMGIVNFFKGLGGFVAKAVGAVGGVLTGKGKDFVLGLINGYSSLIGSVAGFFRGLPGKVVGWIGSLGSTLYNAGASVIQGLINGIENKLSALKNKLSSVTNLIPDWKGPMDKDKKLLTPAGEAIMDSLLRGMDSQLPGLRRFLDSVSGSIESGLSASPSVALAGIGGASSSAAAGDTLVYVTIDGQQLQGRIDKTVRGNNRSLRRSVKAGAR